MSNSKWGFKSAEHALNYEAFKQRARSKSSPVKVYTGEELKKMAETMGFAVSSKHVPPQPKPAKKDELIVEIEVQNLPAGLMKFIKE